MTFNCGTGDEKTIDELSDEELIAERDFWNNKLQPHFYSSSGSYDVSATIVKEIEREMLRRSLEGPPWLTD